MQIKKNDVTLLNIIPIFVFKNDISENKQYIKYYKQMNKKLTSSLVALLIAQMSLAQVTQPKTDDANSALNADENAFTFTEAQLGEDDDMAQNVTIITSNNNLFASQVGFAFSAVRYRYRAFSQKYNDVYVNGLLMNDMETGQFRFSQVGGLNNQTRSQESSLPFEANRYSLSSMAGSNNYDFRAGNMANGQRISLAGANRNYTLRGQYAYSTGYNDAGWALSAGVSYRWANTSTANVEGTFYNSFSYYLGVSKLINDAHTLSLSTWGNPTERASQGGATDEAYWLANNNLYNPYWGYQNGKVRNSRVVNDFAPSAIFTWDWKINSQAKLVTSLGGKYSMYKSTKLNYNNSDNPSPDYWKQMPSAYYDVWDQKNQRNNDYTPEAWQFAYDYLTASKANRQINWDRLYAANKGANLTGVDAMYFLQAKRTATLNLQLNSVLNYDINHNQHVVAGIGLGSNSGRHYQTMEDLLGATSFHNINTYALSDYGAASDAVRYDLNEGATPKTIGEGDVFGYDYYLNIRKATAWANYTANIGRLHVFAGGKTNYTTMQREGMMRNGLAADNSYGKSKVAKFGDGGLKAGMSYNFGHGHALSLGLGYELRAPQASAAFAAPEINNDFVTNLHNEKVFQSELSYQLKSSLVSFNISGYYSRMMDVTEWQNYFFDDENSFTYVSLTGIKKEAYGLEAAAKIKITSFLDFKALGSLSEAKYINNCDARYMMSTSGVYKNTLVYSNGMRESGTPLTATSLGFSYHSNGWFIDLSANWYDRIYLSWSPSLRYEESLKTQGLITTGVDENGNVTTFVNSPDQKMGKGGWMIDGSIGKVVYLRKGQLSINLNMNNLLNNIKLCTGGYEQSRSSYTTNADGSYSGGRVYSFLNNPKKFYAYGTNGMLNVTYKF